MSDVEVIQVDEPADDGPTVVHIPGSGVSPSDLEDALEPYATKLYVDATVSGGDLPAIQSLIDTSVAAHRDSTLPHPVYDSHRFDLIFLNGLV